MKKAIFILLSLMLVGLVPSEAVAGSAYKDVGADAVSFMNAKRAKAGLGKVVVDQTLTKAAAAHAQDMARKRFFSHEGSDGSNVGQRVRGLGYGYCLVAENIAKGQRSMNEALKGWMKSKGHRRNILNPSVVEFGMVRASDDIWVMVLGRPGC